MDPFEMAWQLLKEVGIEGPADPRRPGMSPGMSASTGRMQGMGEDFPPEAYEQLNQALEEEARLREEGMTSEGTHTPSTPTPPPAYERSMRRAPPTPEELGGDAVSGLPPHLQRAYAQYAKPRSASGGRPPQGTSVQNPDDVLRSMSPIDLAMDALQKRTPRYYRGEGGEQFAEHAMTEGADTPSQMSQDDWQENLDIMADGNEHEDDINTPSEIPIDDPARHHQLDVGRQEAMREGIDVPTSDELTPMERFELERRQLRDRPQSPATNPFKMGPSL